MIHNRQCCSHLNGLKVTFACDNCGTVVVEKDAGKHIVQVIDSVKAKKALECVEEISTALSKAVTSYGFCEKTGDILRKYGM